MQALLRASRRLESARIVIPSPDNLPTLLGAVNWLPSLSLIESHLGRLHTAAHSVVKSDGVVPFNPVAAIGAGQSVFSMQKQHLIALELRLLEQKAVDVRINRILSPCSPILLPSRHCGLLPECIEPGNNVEDAAENSNVWQADSVRRKRKKKMNKHKHSKRRKLTRHKR
ncbi:hypothetical protein Ndes2526B_g08918 [Nannochloris sp. 'desiccata']